MPIAIVLDTNFIIEHKNDLQKVRDDLKNSYEVFVTEVSIKERISQRYVELKEKYDKLKKCKKELSLIATIEEIEDLESFSNKESARTTDAYAKEFENNIIPFVVDSNIMQDILDRVFKKNPPFRSEPGASDKGFKDSLIWLSLIDYFKKNTAYDKVILVTNDNGFVDSSEKLIEEFFEKTSLELEISKNKFYDDFVNEKNKIEQELVVAEKTLSQEQIQDIRNKIVELVDEIRLVVNPYNWTSEKNFKTKVIFNEQLSLHFLETLNDVIERNLFINKIWASQVLPPGLGVENINMIDIASIEKLNEFYKQVKRDYPGYVNQFAKAVGDRFDWNYESDPDFDDLPF